MTVFRWIMGVVAGLLGVGSALSFALFIVADVGVWLDRARKLRHLTFAALMFWINIEIWGRVARTLIDWQ